MQYQLKALFIADLGYRLASLALPKDMLPTISDIKVGISYIVRFNEIFARAEIDEHGEVSWPAGNKRGLVGEYFDYIEGLTTAALPYLKEVAGEDLKNAAFAVLRERENGEYATPVSVSGCRPDDTAMQRFVAEKVVYYALRMAKLLNDAGYGRVVPRQSNFNVGNLVDLANLEIFPRNAEEGFTPEVEGEQDTWDIAGILRKEIKVQLDDVEYERVSAIKEAFESFYGVDINTGSDMRDILEDIIVSKRDRAREFIKEQQAASELKGKPRLSVAS